MTKPSELLPINWPGVELQYRAGIKPLRLIGTEFGCSHTAIRMRALKEAWLRDLTPMIHSRADQLVSMVEVSAPVSTGAKAAERATVEASAHAEVAIRLGHRTTAAEAHRIAQQMLATLKESANSAELFKRVREVLDSGDEPTAEQRQYMRDLVGLVASLPQRVATLKNLVDALARVILVERQSYGLDTAAGTDGRPLVIIRDFTGEGDVDAPKRPEAPGSRGQGPSTSSSRRSIRATRAARRSIPSCCCALVVAWWPMWDRMAP